MYRIFIVEDHASIREAFRSLVNREADMTVCGVAANGTEALQQIPTLDPHLVLVDLSLPDMDGFALIEKLLAGNPNLITLMVSGHPPRQYEEFAQRAGAVGYLDKVDSHMTLIPKIRSILTGDSTS
jgi:DNA-binding NarL/FixJ family response regulator